MRRSPSPPGGSWTSSHTRSWPTSRPRAVPTPSPPSTRCSSASRRGALEHLVLERLRAGGFHVEDDVKLCHGLAEAIAFHARLRERRDKLPYEVDGVVIKVDD